MPLEVIKLDDRVKGVAATCLGFVGTVIEVVTEGSRRKFKVRWDNGGEIIYFVKSIALLNPPALAPAAAAAALILQNQAGAGGGAGNAGPLAAAADDENDDEHDNMGDEDERNFQVCTYLFMIHNIQYWANLLLISSSAESAMMKREQMKRMQQLHRPQKKPACLF